VSFSETYAAARCRRAASPIASAIVGDARWYSAAIAATHSATIAAPRATDATRLLGFCGPPAFARVDGDAGGDASAFTGSDACAPARARERPRPRRHAVARDRPSAKKRGRGRVDGEGEGEDASESAVAARGERAPRLVPGCSGPLPRSVDRARRGRVDAVCRTVCRTVSSYITALSYSAFEFCL
jgi:hypothetical protein